MAGLEARLRELTADEALWAQARPLARERRAVEATLRELEALTRELVDAAALHELAEAEGDGAVVAEVQALLPELAGRLRRLELRRWLAGPDDQLGALVHVRAGVGGPDAQRWALTVLRMYTRWAGSHGYRTVLVDLRDQGEDGGLTSAVLAVEAPGALGLLRGETGGHRLVDILPGDPGGRRHVATVEVDVTPDLPDGEGPALDPADLEVSLLRHRGFSCGGAHRDGLVPAIVRVRHLPTGLVCSCGEERSQLRNRAQALRMLRGKLAARASGRGDVSAGPVRSYVLAPRERVVDLRTGHETSQARAVLDGGLDDLLEASLRR